NVLSCVPNQPMAETTKEHKITYGRTQLERLFYNGDETITG
ncbi:14436_t:CDS:1, partial [Gigaspora rosea]